MDRKGIVLAIDQGTTGTKVLALTEELKKVAESTVDFEQHFPKPGWVEHDLNQIWDTVVKGISNCIQQGLDPKKVIAIGITNQRETIGFWDKKSVRPIARAIVWQDRRTADECQKLKSQGLEPEIQKKTGLLLDPYFSGTKLSWALQNWLEVESLNQSKQLAVGTIDSFLLAKLTSGISHCTEPSNASRTLCFHISKHEWDQELCELLKISPDILPEVRPSTGKFGVTKGVPGLPDGIPITGILGDQQSALLGQGCLTVGSAKCTYGTGSFLLMNSGNTPVFSKHRLLTTIAWAFDEKSYTYALEGSAFIAGAAVQWVRDGLKFIQKSEEIESLAQTVPSSDKVVFVPALTGLGAPHWDPHATGMFTGLTRGTQRGHMARAVLEGIAFQNADILHAMEKDLGKPLRQLNVDGGACKNNLLMQFQADILQTELTRPEFTETTSLGAVFAAGLGIGLWKDPTDVLKVWKKERAFIPRMDKREQSENMKRWQEAVARVTHHMPR